MRHDGAAAQVAGGAFHGVIRLAWALDSGDVDDIAHALAYVAAVTHDDQPAQLAPKAGSERSLFALALRLQQSGIERPPGRLISARLHGVAVDPRFVAIADDIAVHDGTLTDVAAFGARLYAAADDFASLHVVTGADAVMVLAPHFSDQLVPARAAARAALGCFVLAGLPDLDGIADAMPVDDDAAITKAAIVCNDDHVCKLMASCLRHARRTGDRAFRAIATRATRRGSS